MAIPLPPLDAFRADRAHSAQPTAGEGAWLQVALLAHRAGALPASERTAHLEQASALLPGAPQGDAAEKVIAAALQMEDATRLHLALSTLDGALRLLSETDVERRGRVLSYQGRVLRQLGDVASAEARYQAAERLGETHGERAIVARAWVGYGILAQVRGNLPEARTHFERVLIEREAAADSRQVAHHGLMVCAAGRGDMDAAARHAWAAYVESDGFERAAALVALSETLHRAGHPRTALAGFAAAVRQPILPRHELPALGGLAVSATHALARPAAARLVNAARFRIDALVADTYLPYAHASSLIELADALSQLGSREIALRSAERARAIAATHRFHELQFRAEALMNEGTHPTAVRETAAAAPAHILSAVESLVPFESLESGELVLSAV